jgi:CRISPR-associated protein Csm3
MTTKLKLKKYVTITGTLECKTGLRIGGSQEELEIGGMDNPIIRDPVDKLPYIPGSSLKGKLRSTLEYKYDRVGQNGSPCGCAQALDVCPVCSIFGPHLVGQRAREPHGLGPSRLIVRDAALSPRSRDELRKLNEEEGLQYAELKTENIIDRRTGTALHPRTQERVPKGTTFDLNMSLRVFEGDDEAKMVTYIKEALEWLQKDYLGGSGTRGYGWIEVKDLRIE